MKAENGQNQVYSTEWQGQRSQKIKTEKRHVGPIQSTEDSEAQHPLFSMGGRRHYEEKLSDAYKWKSCAKAVDTGEAWTDKGMKKIIENYVILKPKVERIGGQDDFEKLVGGNQIMQKYNGVKQIAAKEKVAQKRQQERLARTFSKYKLVTSLFYIFNDLIIADAGITIMTVHGPRKITQNSSQALKEAMNEEKKMRQTMKQ